MNNKTQSDSAKNRLLLGLLRPYLRNRFIDRGKWFLMNRLNPQPGNDSGWAKLGFLECKMPNGKLIRCDMQHAADRFMYYTGEYEIGASRFVAQVLGKNWRMVDVGANVGKYTVIVAPLVKEVHCFEPNPASRTLLKANIELNRFSNVQIYSCGLSDQEGQGLLLQGGEDIGGASLLDLRGDSQQIGITIAIGDTLIASNDQPVYIKIDVEGFEEHVLRGFRKLLSEKKSVVQVEITSDWLREAGGSAESLFSFMQELGYCAFKIGTKSRIRTSPDLVRLTHPLSEFQYDVVFLPFDNLQKFWSWISKNSTRD